MATQRKVFYLGPLGGLTALPGIQNKSSVNAPPEHVGGLHLSLDGTATRDRMGFKRGWKFSWDHLLEDEHTNLEAAFAQVGRKTLRLVDPQQRNRATLSASCGGQDRRSTSAFTPVAGTVAWAASEPPSVLGLPSTMDGATVWSVPATTSSDLRVDTALRIPVIPDDTTITVSFALAGTTAGNIQVGVLPYNLAGTAGTAVFGTSSSLTLTGEWRSYTYTPGGTDVSYVPVIRAASGSARSVRVYAVQVEAGSSRSAWRPGYGCPRVLVRDFRVDYPYTGEYDVTASLREV